MVLTIGMMLLDCVLERRCGRGVGGDDAEGVPSEEEPGSTPCGVPLRDEGRERA